ncbi:sigma-70 family RNA polymerase sigma factor [Alicyclobacillus dauci]|uniref:Sigma-70 family RNA polymerase sigma factor n=1 Tax=Alicyclobacillus dauci TaxID=1475485 RepID=A0ABY6Z1X8_9BACL|nr:sigma-70 family RNA polymerase sigma factor [Alicyclobacillus dauci]WAH36842.1 sigma-70 family RNA polymerase sigma factor [Alicyclobacillus dauci]
MACSLGSQQTEMVLAAQLGDGDALAELLGQYEGLLVTVARRYRLTCGFDEVYQEACLAFIRAVYAYDPDMVPFPAFASARVRGDVLTAMRRWWRVADRQKWITPMDDEDDTEALERMWDEHGQSGPSIEDAWLLEHDLNSVIAYASLSERETSWLHAFLRGYTLDMIRRRYGVSSETVKTWRKRALAKLKRAARVLGYEWQDFV